MYREKKLSSLLICLCLLALIIYLYLLNGTDVRSTTTKLLAFPERSTATKVFGLHKSTSATTIPRELQDVVTKLLLHRQVDGTAQSVESIRTPSDLINHPFPDSKNTLPKEWSDPSRTKLMREVLDNFRALLPSEYLPEYRNPCWFADYSNVTSHIASLSQLQDKARKGLEAHQWRMHCLPYFYVMGYSKCGTTMLWTLLSKHPDYVRPAGKEAATLSKRRYSVYFKIPYPGIANSLLKYMSFFDPAVARIKADREHHVTGDCSADVVWELPFKTSYDIVYPDSMAFMVSTILPKARLIAIVRDPVDRLVSDFYMATAGKCKMAHTQVVVGANFLHDSLKVHFSAFNDCMKVRNDEIFCMYNYQREWLRSPPNVPVCASIRIAATMYYYTLIQWLKYFPRDRLLVLNNAHLQKNSTAVALEMYKHLGFSEPNQSVIKSLQSLQRSNYHAYLNREIHREGTQEKYVREDTKQMIRNFFHVYNVKLANLLQDESFLFRP